MRLALALALLGLTGLGCAPGEGPEPDGGPGRDRAASPDREDLGTADAPGVNACGEPDPFVGGRIPELLSQTLLYEDIGAQRIDPRNRYYTVHYPLWADLAGKDRWVYLPCDSQIDTSDMDYWQMPVGSRFYKTFGGTSDLAGLPFETRIIARYGPGPDDFVFATYAWRQDAAEADLVPSEGLDQASPAYRFPSLRDCQFCHSNHPSRVLGFAALQLSRTSLYNLESLAQENRLTQAPPPEGYAIPGNAIEQQGLGYLQGNCSHCHNPRGIQLGTPYVLLTSVNETTVQQTGPYRTAVGVALSEFNAPAGVTMRIAPGNPAQSAIIYRMSQRTPEEQMPPVASQFVDYTAVYLRVGKWIESLQ